MDRRNGLNQGTYMPPRKIKAFLEQIWNSRHGEEHNKIPLTVPKKIKDWAEKKDRKEE